MLWKTNYKEVAEVLESARLKAYISYRLRILQMNHVLDEKDVINYVALCLVETLRSGKPVSYPFAWAKIVSVRYINSQYNKFKNSYPLDSEKIEYLINRKIEYNTPFDEDDKEEIYRKIKQLTPTNQKIIMWRFFQNLSWTQIAELLTQEEGKTISNATARKRGERALNELREKYLNEL